MKFKPKRRLSAFEKYKEKHPKTIYVGAKLTKAQLDIAQRITQGNERFFIWCSGRQTGKSFCATQILLYTALNHPNTVSMYVSMTYPQTLKLFNELYRGIKGSGCIASYSKSDFYVEFVNGSQIYFKSYQNSDSCRGYHISGICIIDEAAWMADNDFESIFIPMMQNHKQSKALLISSPRGTNWFHKYYLKGCKHTASGLLNKNFVSFKTTYKDNPFCSLEEIELYRETMPEKIFQQEILAEFVSGAFSAFGDIYKKCLYQEDKKIYNEDYYFGIDVGRKDDYTVCTVIGSITGKVYEIYRERYKSFESIANDICNLIRKYKPKQILQETNGIGDPFFELLEKKIAELGIYTNQISPLQGFTTTNATKNNIVEALRIAFERKEILIPDNLDLTDELDTFEVEYSRKSHSVTYSAKQGCHDDMVLSLCLANWIKRTANPYIGKYGVA